MSEPVWRLHLGGGQLVATAIHDGHELRPEVADLMALSDAERLREEDPFTAEWTTIAPTRLVGTRSKFEVGSAQKFTNINFARYVIDAIDRKVQYMNFYGRNFDNDEICTL
jgi:hypothetical protein